MEHHFTDYTMCPDVLQFLSYMAGRTEHAKLGSMVVVLPWHDPVRVAEEFVMLDNLSDGRVVVGVGRGLARVEYQGFRLDMNQSRTRFNESAEMLVNALEQGFAEFDGELVQQPRVEIRPNPFKTFEGRTYAAAISPESSVVLAKLGVGVLIIPQKPWNDVQNELASYRATYQEVNEGEPPAPVVVTFAYCDEDEEKAAEMARKYVGGYWESVMKHYEFRSDHLKTTRRLRVLRRLHRQDQHLRRPRRCGLFREPAGYRHAGAVLPEGDGHPRLHRHGLAGGVIQLRRHALRGCRGQHAPVRL